MGIIADLKKGLALVKKIKEVKDFFDKNAIDKDLQEDIAAIKGILDRMGKKVEVFNGVWDIIFGNGKK